MNMNTKNELHPFERAKLGTAPFRVVAYEYMRGPMKRIENGVAVTYGSPGQPMGTCDYCGACLVHVFFVRSADDKVFRVGSDCVHKTSGTKLRQECAKLVREHRAQKRRESYRERQAQWALEAKEKADAWRAENPWWDEFLFYSGDSDFGRSLSYALDKWGTLTTGQAEAAQRSIASHKSPKGLVPKVAGRTLVIGKVVRVRDTVNNYGVVRKVLLNVDTPTGPYKLWGTLPSIADNAKPGDELRFTAQMDASPDDPHFGFFRRPTKVTLNRA